MSNDVRFDRGKARLIQHEQIISKERAVMKRLGKTLPEETIEIPKIGEWELSEVNGTHSPKIFSPARMSKRTATKSMQVTRAQNRSSVVSELGNRAPDDPDKPPFVLKPPRIIANDVDPLERQSIFPPGTVSTDLDQIIKSRHRARPLPPLKTQDVVGDDNTGTFLPLELFDDASYAEYPLEELLKEPIAYSKFSEIDGKSMGIGQWKRCKILNYDPETRLFLIQWDGTQKRKKVARFNLRFAKEDPEKFEKRIQAAKRACALHESILRFESRVAQMPTGNLPSLSREDITEMHTLIGSNIPSKYIPILRELDAEVEQDFKLNNNRMEFIFEVEHNPLIPNRDEFMALRRERNEIREYGLAEKYDYDFAKIFGMINDVYVMANRRILEGLQTVWGIFEDSQQLSLLTDGFPGTLSIEDFREKQLKHLTTTTNAFRASIQETLEGVLTSTVSDSMNASTQKEKRRYSNMIMLTQRMLHTVLIKIADNTLNNYQRLFDRYIDDDDVCPQFHLSLIIDETRSLALVPSLEGVNMILFELIQKLEDVLKQLPHMTAPVMEMTTEAPTMIECDDFIKLIDAERETLKQTNEKLFSVAQKFVDDYKFLEKLLKLDPETYSEQFDPEGKRTLVEYKEKLTEFKKNLSAIKKMPVEGNNTIFLLSCAQFKQRAFAHIQSLTNSLLSQIKKFAMQAIEELKVEFDSIVVELQKMPKTPEELAAMKAYLENVIETSKIRNKKMNFANQRFTFLEDFHFEVSNREFDIRYQTLQMPQKITSMMEETEKMLSVERIRMIRELRSNQRKLEDDVMDLSEQVKAFAEKFNDIEMAFDAVYAVNQIDTRLRTLIDLQTTYNSHEKLFEFEQGSSKVMNSIVDEFRPLHDLWNLASRWLEQNASWLDGLLAHVRADTINQTIIQSVKMITKLKKTLGNHKVLLDKVLTPLSSQIDTFKKRVPLITKLRHPGIKTKHWEQISEIVGFSILPQELTLQEFLDMNLERWNDQITEIASVAAQEYNLESALDQMDAELQQKMFVTVHFRESNHFIMQEVDDIVTTIDDQLVTTQTLLTSPFIGPIKKRATEKLEFLQESHACLDDWISCQRSWLYLFPIFTGTSIQQKLFKEAREWATVDKIWLTTMTLTHEHPEFMTVMHSNKLHANLTTCNELLDSITKGLNTYLESKRLGFPRFFFLSNDELISFLSHTKDFSKIQDSMQKLFEYVASISVTDNLEITHINDSEGEVVQLFNPVDGNTTEIEDWLNAFEDEMRSSLKEYIRQALGEYTKRKREQWIGMFPAQVILISNQILWTQQVTNGVKVQQVRGLKKLKTKFIDQLTQLTTVIRQPISKLLRQVISCLLINEVHNRDIIESLIIGEVSDIEDFKWLKQLRYYWEDETVYVRSINNNYEYSYEYAGNSPRLVITPLTDRCYQTLLSAFKQFLSGAPSGPAGTGKTETVRDCAKALGRNCVVYNCSEEVTPEQMSQFFAGLSSSGSWSCFDEFNRINIEVLSVIAQQVRSIQEAIAANAETFKLDQRTLRLNVNAAICITMNPGYAGRTELPDNLKALFRPCAMMVPDFGFICEILLFSGGFKEASMLSVKMVSIFDLCRKQLSNQYHYDWGLRAMKAILSTAAKMKRNDLERDESSLLVQAIRDNTAPRLVSIDLPLFSAILKDVFPQVNSTKGGSERIVARLRDAFNELNCQPLTVHTTKCVELYETTLVRHGIMLVGGSLGGKSVAWKSLARALTTRAEEEKDGLPVHVETLNPKAISIAELYGSFNPITSEWADGVLSQSIRHCSFSEQNELKWIIVDGPVDSLWIESMNSLLDDNKVLCLPNNERIQLGPHVKMVFEVDDLSQASPATVSRCGMVYFDPSALPWNMLMHSWTHKYEEAYGPVVKKIRQLMERYVPSLIQFIKMDGKPAMQFNPNFAVSSLMKLMDIYMQLFRESKKQLNESGEEWTTVDSLDQSLFKSPFAECTTDIPYYTDKSEGAVTVFERILIFGFVWCFGGVLSADSRLMFDRFLKEQMIQAESPVQFPKDGTVFDYWANPATNEWSLWCNEDTGYTLDMDKPLEMEFVPTKETAPVYFFSRIMLSSQHHVLMHGPTSSKTLLAKTLLSKSMDRSKFDCHVLPLANCSTPRSISKFVQDNMHKRQRNYCPLKGQSMVFFIDNLGAVKPEIYGAQPALELLRQYFDYGGWFNTATVEFTGIADTSIFAAMGVPGGGLYDIPERLLRHFFVIHLPKIKSMKYILNKLLGVHFNKFDGFVQELVAPTVDASIDVFKQCLQNLLPIPSKLHYVFDVRNIIKVFKGMLLSASDDVSDNKQFIKLWYHEVMRVFGDRLNTVNDRMWFSQKMSTAVAKHFHITWESIRGSGAHVNNLMFNTFADGTGRYKETLIDKTEMLKMCNTFLEEHNRESSKQLDIVLFHEAIEHMSSLSRILATPEGHGMLVGIKSSGRKSLARLSLHMASIDPFEISITKTYSFDDWRSDIKNLMKQCGIDDIPSCFIISDVQIIGSYQLEDLSNLLISGDIPMLYEREEKDQIRAEMAASEVGAGEGDFFELFMRRVKKNLHVLLVASPFGSVFKDIMLYYPAIRDGTTIDWYMPWSQNALESVAKVFLKGIHNSDKVVSVCVRIHKSVEDFAARFLKEAKRFTSATPSRYFELLATFQKKLADKRAETEAQIHKYANGVTQIETTRKQIEAMSLQLDHDIPVLQATRADVEGMMKELDVKRQEVEVTKSEVQKKSDIAEQEAKEASDANQIAQDKFSQAQPLLAEAQEAVMKLDKDSLVKIKKLHAPTSGMKEVFEAVCIMFGRSPRRVESSVPGVKEDDYWPETVTMLNDVQFIKNVTNFKIEGITKEIINKLKKYCPNDENIRSEKRKTAMQSYAAVAALYDWVCASFDYWFVYQEILPLKQAADEAAKKLAASEALLAEARAHLASVEARLQELQDKFKAMQDKEQELTNSVQKTQARLLRAQKLITGLSGETKRWEENVKKLQGSSAYILGDSILIAGVLTYIGAFSPSFRTDMLNRWKTYLNQNDILFSENFTITQVLGTDSVIREWVAKGLPNDNNSIENALIITSGEKSYPLMIDPQLSGTKWLRAVEGERLNVLRFDQADFLQRFKGCVSFGLPVLITDVGLKLDPLIDPILSREVLVVDGQKRVTIGGESIAYNDDFRLYISTKYPNPQYSPEVCSQITLINFTTTEDGLTDLLLNNLIEVEREDLDRKRLQIMEAGAENAKKLLEIEKEILEIVSNAGSDILDDDNALDTLQKAQKMSAVIAQQIAASETTEKQITQFKNRFHSVAARAALLYFCVADFSVIDPMYQFSLMWFVNLFRNAIMHAEHPQENSLLINSFNMAIARKFYENVSFSLFSRHKLLFSSLLVIRILHSEKKISSSELAYLLSPVPSEEPKTISFISNDVWPLIANLKQAAPVFETLVEHISKNEKQWQKYVESDHPEKEKIPFDKALSSFQRFMILRFFHLEKARKGLRRFIQENLGEEFVTPPTLNLVNVFNESSPLCPLIFIIMPGIDPMDEIVSVATRMEMDKYVKSYSLGRGRGNGAEELITDAAERGFWVVLQNCHLSLSWMPRLEFIMNNMDPAKVHSRFRLLLVTMSSPEFPIGLLYQGTKLIYEIPKGMRENVMRIYNAMNADEFESPDTSITEKQMTFNLAFFHAVVLERLQFGSIGWNIPYEFNPSDFYISKKHLRVFLNESTDIPYEALSYVIGELNYGGRVTDAWDRRLLLSILDRFFNPNTEIASSRYPLPDFNANLQALLSTVESWPVVTQGEDVGLSVNATTITARNEALKIFSSLVEVQPTLVASSDSMSEEQFAINLVESLQKKVPKPFNLSNFTRKFDLKDTLATVVHHELLLYNKLIGVISDSLESMDKGLRGLILIDEQLDLLKRRLLANRVPEIWLEHSFPSILNLRNYMDDLGQRVAFFDSWVSVGAPVVFRLGAFYHPEEFLTAILQCYARKHVVPFDSLKWTTTPVREKKIHSEPEEGIYVEGLPIEGAMWNEEEETLVECGQLDLVNSLPVMHLKPTDQEGSYDPKTTYECPVYRTQNRGTGALDLPNCIMSFYLPTKKLPPEHWIQRSVAAFITVQ